VSNENLFLAVIAITKKKKKKRLTEVACPKV